MATQAPAMEDDRDFQQDHYEDSPLDILKIMDTDNLIDVLPADVVRKIGQRCREDFQYDWDSRTSDAKKEDPHSWEQRYDRYLNVAMQVRKAKTFPWPQAANIKLPLLTTACVQFQARSYPVIVDGSNLVKGRVLGEDPQGIKRARADRIGDHMTWQLLYDMPGWEEDTDRLLLMLPIVGCVFRKTYYDPIRRKNMSKMITAKDFVINYWAKSIEEAPRFTQIIRFYPYEVEERIRSGQWAEIQLNVQQSETDQSETAPVDFLEQHCRMDLDDDGYPEPYVVTLLRENGNVVRIVPCFDADGVTMVEETGEVIRIEQKRYFTKYGFIPAPDGSFYDIGFGALLDDITTAIDTTVNQMLDAGALQNAQGGFIGSGVNMRSGDMKFRLGEWKRVDVTGGTLAQNIVPLTLPGPSTVLYSLLELLIGQAKEITSVQDILTGAGQGVNTPATTVLAQIEQATKVMTAIFKRIHRSFGQELRILFGLNRDFLDDKAYYALTDTPGEIGRADYEDKDIDVIPVSDPTQVNDALAAVRSQALSAFIGDPLINQEVLRRRMLEGQGQPDIDELMKVPPPPPDPKVLLEGMKMSLQRMKAETDADKARADSVRAFIDSAEKAFMLGLLPDVALFADAAQQLAQETMGGMNEPADGPGNIPGMEGPPADAGVPGVPGEPPLGPDGAMGAGLGAGGPGGAGEAVTGGDFVDPAPAQM